MSFSRSGNPPSFGTFSHPNSSSFAIFSNSSSPSPPGPPTITGGNTSIVDGYKVHSFTNTGPNGMTVTGGPATVQILIVAGGGRSGTTGDNNGGGGGGGGVYYSSSYTLQPGTYTVNVGAGSEHGPFQDQTNGQNSNIYMGSTLILYDVPGGGDGGHPLIYSSPVAPYPGFSGGSGGGGTGLTSISTGGAGISPFGHDGGTAYGVFSGARGRESPVRDFSDLDSTKIPCWSWFSSGAG